MKVLFPFAGITRFKWLRVLFFSDFSKENSPNKIILLLLFITELCQFLLALFTRLSRVPVQFFTHPVDGIEDVLAQRTETIFVLS